VAHRVRGKVVDFVADASSRRRSPITTYRWDFGDGSAVDETAVPSISHEYGKGARGSYSVRVQAVDSLTRSGLATTTVTILRR
jgi:PKD repeat protein